MPLRLLLLLRWVLVALIIMALLLILIRRKLPPSGRRPQPSTNPYADLWLRWRESREDSRERASYISALRGKTVLIADPEEKSSRVLTWRLQKLRCRVYRARTGAQALARAAEIRPDVVVADALLADVSAVDFYRNLPDGVSAVVFVGVMQTHWQEIRALGANVACLAKPFDPDEAASAAGAILSRAAS